MDIVNKIGFLLNDMDSGATVTGNVATNTAKGQIDIVGGKCPNGQVYDTEKKVCVSMKSEAEEDNPSYNQKISTMNQFVKDGIMTFDEAAGKIATMFDFPIEKIKKDMEKVAKGKPASNETSVVGGSYIGGTTVNITGSGQTRTTGVKYNNLSFDRGSHRGLMIDLDRKNKALVPEDDPAKKNIDGRTGLLFNPASGAYEPDQWNLIDFVDGEF